MAANHASNLKSTRVKKEANKLNEALPCQGSQEVRASDSNNSKHISGKAKFHANFYHLLSLTFLS